MHTITRNLLIFTSIAVVTRACLPYVQESASHQQLQAQAMKSPVIDTRSVLVTGEDGAKVGTLLQDDPAAIRIRYHKRWDCEPGAPLLMASQEWTWTIKGGAADGQVKGIDCSGLITDPAYTYYRGEPAVVERVAGTANVTIGGRVFSWVE